MAKLALAIIVKDELEQVTNIVEKYGKYFDEICLAVDKRYDEFVEKLGDKCSIYQYEWCDDFSHKRNFLAEKVKSPYYFRIDCDDEIKNPEFIRETLDKLESSNISICYVPYFYSRDEHGNTNAKHWRETIIRKQPDIYWMKKIHENVHIVDQSKINVSKTDKFSIVHNIDQKHAEESFKRNFKILWKEFEQDGDKTDVRTLSYIGNNLFAVGQWKLAIVFLTKVVQRSGWDDDKYYAYIHMAVCYHNINQPKQAIACCNEALAINTKFPDAYLQMGTIYLDQGQYDKALDWLMPGLVRPEPDTMFVTDPSVYTYRARMNIALAYFMKGDFKQALDYFYKAKHFVPNHEFVRKNEPLFIEAYENNEYLERLMWIIKFAEARDRNKVQDIVNSIPSPLFKDERFWAIKNKYSDPKRWDDKTVVFYCGNAWEEWSPASTLTGIGGSEEAVIYLAKEVAKLGYDVTVFNSCGEQAGVYDKVKYRPFWEFNPRDYYDILISWRHNIFRNGIIARRRIIWLHDVPDNNVIMDSDHYDYDRVIVLSEFHKSLLPSYVPKDRIVVSSNGINLDDFNDSFIERNPYRMIYTSSYDRGIEHLLVNWGKVKQAVPEAELHLFYGWDTWIAMEKKGYRDSSERLRLQKLMSQDGIFEHGRIGHKQLVKELQKSKFWVYPSHFEEISCISAMKAQAAGCIPVCTNYAALKETVKKGVIVEGQCIGEEMESKYIDALIGALKSTEEFVPVDKSIFGWDRVAKQWSSDVFAKNKIKFKDMEHYVKFYSGCNKMDATSFKLNAYPSRYAWAVDVAKNNDNIKTSLDIGSFDGYLAYMLCKETNGRIESTALDITDNGYKDARLAIEKENLNVHLEHGIPFEQFDKGIKYDLITCFEMLEHVIDVDGVIKHISDLLSCNGIAMFTMPNKNGKFGDNHDIMFNEIHIREYDIEELKRDVEKHLDILDYSEGDLNTDGLIYVMAQKRKVIS